MSELKITLIDVAWGDSIFIESTDDNGDSHYALIDSNDTSRVKSSYIFLKRFFEKKGIDVSDSKPLFEFIMLSHAHMDHGEGLKEIMKYFGTKNFYYPKSINWKSLVTLINYANRSINVEFHESIDSDKIFRNLGDVAINVLWPRHNQPYNRENENNNSIVLAMTLNDITFMLTGDAEEEVWQHISAQIPDNTRLFKVPHHGSVNGTFEHGTRNSSYLDRLDELNPKPELAISSHVVPYGHPHQDVIDELNQRGYGFYRTDENYHITISIDGAGVHVKYSR